MYIIHIIYTTATLEILAWHELAGHTLQTVDAADSSPKHLTC